MIPFWPLLTGLLWLGFLIAVGILILAYRSYRNLQPLRQAVIDASDRVETALRERMAQIEELSAFLAREGGWRPWSAPHSGSVIASYRASSRLLHEMRAFADRLPELKQRPEYRDLIRRIDLSAAAAWQRIDAYHVAYSNYELARVSFPALLSERFVDPPRADVLDLRALRELKATVNPPMREAEAGDNRNLFYVLPGGVPKGPVSAEDLRNMIKAGVIPRDAMVAEANSKEWRRIKF